MAARTEHPYTVETLSACDGRLATLWRGGVFAEAVAAFEHESAARPGEVVALCCGARIVRRNEIAR